MVADKNGLRFLKLQCNVTTAANLVGWEVAGSLSVLWLLFFFLLFVEFFPFLLFLIYKLSFFLICKIYRTFYEFINKNYIMG